MFLGRNSSETAINHDNLLVFKISENPYEK